MCTVNMQVISLSFIPLPPLYPFPLLPLPLTGLYIMSNKREYIVHDLGQHYSSTSTLKKLMAEIGMAVPRSTHKQLRFLCGKNHIHYTSLHLLFSYDLYAFFAMTIMHLLM